jgi:hypothetical protein
MEQGKGGLLNFFNKLATEDDKKMTVALWREGREGTFTQGQGFRQHSDASNDAKHEHEKELARVRKQKERSNTRKIEIARGERSPGGTKKRKVKSARCFETTFSINLQAQPLQLQDQAPKRFKGSVAEITRPNRAAAQHVRDVKKLKESRGRKQTNPDKVAVYTNWMTPTLWVQIEAAARHPSMGLDLNVTALLKVLRQRNFEIFEHLSHTTVHGWIDRSGDKARWSDKTLARAEAANFQGHPNGGRRGILVRGTISTGGILALIRFSVSVSRCCGHYHGASDRPSKCRSSSDPRNCSRPFHCDNH